MANIIKDISMTEFFHNKIGNCEIICYGAGKKGKNFAEQLEQVKLGGKILFFIDKDPSKLFLRAADNYPVYDKACLLDLNKQNVKIVITTQYYEEILNMDIWKELPDAIEIYIYEDLLRCEEYERTFSNRNAGRNYYLINTPTHGNLGDHAIAVAEYQFLNRIGIQDVIELTGSFIRKYSTKLKKYIKAEDCLLITGGGYMGTLWPTEENTIQYIVSQFPLNKIIIFPQTIFYEEKAKKKQAKELYTNHSNLMICARERVSYALIHNKWKMENVLLIPDMVLNIDLEEKEEIDREGILICLKNDKESKLSENQKKYIRKTAEKKCSMVKVSDTVLDFRILPQERIGYVNQKIQEFRKSKLVITDRMHGMIFAAITGTPCIVLDNSYFKLSAAYEMIRKVNNIAYCKEIRTLDILLEDMYEKPVYLKRPNYKEAYEKLEKILLNEENACRK